MHIQAEASSDAFDAALWYETQRPGLGIEFVLELGAALDKVVESPQLYPAIFLEVRRVLLRRFPYSAYFVFDENLVEVFAILHQHRDPRRWRDRVSNP
ncbi:MAG: type II toxin-antitoxin system RelE/ParE family toxin [Gammaproteobacteria bacterium]|nr:type II toxin-antitoxin system RelE/ParE family toxin [Gammaproteobacteria bacterium]